MQKQENSNSSNSNRQGVLCEMTYKIKNDMKKKTRSNTLKQINRSINCAKEKKENQRLMLTLSLRAMLITVSTASAEQTPENAVRQVSLFGKPPSR